MSGAGSNTLEPTNTKDILKNILKQITVGERKDIVVVDRKIEDQTKCLEVEKKGIGNSMKEISLWSLEECKLVQTGRKLLERLDGGKDEEKEKQEEGRKRSTFAEKISVFEKKTPMKRRKPDGREKMTPISWRKTENYLLHQSQGRFLTRT